MVASGPFKFPKENIDLLVDLIHCHKYRRLTNCESILVVLCFVHCIVYNVVFSISFVGLEKLLLFINHIYSRK